jgi:predicted alpha/beta-hydrolase family hydrolase
VDTVTGIYPVAILGHGASGTAVSMRPWIGALASHGVASFAIDLPRGRAERAVPVFDKAITASGGSVVAGGHSFGGRVASIAIANRRESGDAGVRGLLLLSYPLHRPGKPDLWADRTAHWRQLRLPVLLLSGEADPFARLDLLREAVELLPDGHLVTYPRVGHGLMPVLGDAADQAARFIRAVTAGDRVQ